MRPVTAIITIALATIISVGVAWIGRGEFGIGPEWVLPILLAFLLPIREEGKNE